MGVKEKTLGVPIWDQCQQIGCGKKVDYGKKYCTKEHAPFWGLRDDNNPQRIEEDKALLAEETIMRIRSAKAKGRRLSELTRQLILKYFPEIPADDLKVTPSSSNGEDLQFSTQARQTLPLIIECKNQEKWTVLEAMLQAEDHKRRMQNVEFAHPMVVIAKNRVEPLAVMRLDNFLKLISKR